MAKSTNGAPRSRRSSIPADVVGAASDVVAAAQKASAPVTRKAARELKKLGKQLEAAARDGAHFAVIIGDELSAGNVQLRDLEAGTQRAVAFANLARELERATRTHRHGVTAESSPGIPHG